MQILYNQVLRSVYQTDEEFKMLSENLHRMDHPLIRHKISLLRQKETNTKEFRQLVHEIAMLIGYEAARDLELQAQAIQTPLCETEGYTLARHVCLVPILRAGLGMVDGLLSLFPAAHVGHLGFYRDPKTLAPVEYYCKLPSNIADCEVFILDPMLATGGSSSVAISCLKEQGVSRIRLLNIVASPEGAQHVLEAHPDVTVYLGAMDVALDENGYILPGLGDAGDRLFGTF